MIPTSEKLAKAMEEESCSPEMINKAREGYYDDFKSPLATPCIQLVNDLKAIGKEALMRRAMYGEFDAQRWESDAWAKTPEGKEMTKSLMKGFL